MIPSLLLLEEALKEIVIAGIEDSHLHAASKIRGRSVEVLLVARGDGYDGPCTDRRHCCCKADPGSTADH